MYPQPRTMFLQRKIMDLQQALFFCDSDAVLKFPVTIINVLQVDEVGQVWFLLNRPAQDLKEFNNVFCAKLDFYKKGKEYYMHVRGKASIVADPEEMNHVHVLDEQTRALANSSMVLIRMKVTDVRYYPAYRNIFNVRPLLPNLNFQPSAFFKSLQYIIKDIIPVFQSH